jgi:hypothetical protein
MIYSALPMKEKVQQDASLLPGQQAGSLLYRSR